MMARELDAPLGVAGIQLEVGQMSGDADAEDKGFEQFEQFLEHWSRRDFLKRTGGVAAYMAFAAGGLSFLEACGGGTPTTSLTPKRAGHVIEGNFSDIRTLNSMLSSDTASNQVIGLMFDGLLNYSKTGDLVPALAKSMPTTSTDGLTYKFTLRDNLKFSDGQPLTADDVVFTYQLAYDPKYKDVSSPRRGDLQKYIASVTAPDPKTVVITTTTVFAPFLANHALYGIAQARARQHGREGDQHRRLQHRSIGDQRRVQIRQVGQGPAGHAGAQRQLLERSRVPRLVRLQGPAGLGCRQQPAEDWRDRHWPRRPVAIRRSQDGDQRCHVGVWRPDLHVLCVQPRPQQARRPAVRRQGCTAGPAARPQP